MKPGIGMLTTSVLLQSAVFATVQIVLYIPLMPVNGLLASAFPPAYAVVAGVNSIMIFAARLFTGQRGVAVVTSMFTGLFVAAMSPIGLLIAVPFIAVGTVFDLTLSLVGSDSQERSMRVGPAVLAAIATALILFAVSLPVFSQAHLTPAFLSGTFLGRVLGQVGGLIFAAMLVQQLRRAGVGGQRR